MKIHLYYIGKPRDQNANSMAEDYIQRCSRYARTEMREIQPSRFDPWLKHPSAKKILLDPAGKPQDSAQFTKLIAKAEQESRDVLFIIGGADGLPAAWRDRADLLLSLSGLTFPHELARVILAEQLYRAFTTLRGHPYPR
ncbi:MAG TPA: 23S rRNA (pseudouridine(1915)-N(3))-methyltransferase RlmH [Bryobacteraceae bacterium]|nr:23S rRNA (pseudouridine(1915)-N(3))-methyltransferase RlmH [Bryobacteraceae bacterium]